MRIWVVSLDLSSNELHTPNTAGYIRWSVVSVYVKSNDGFSL
jgi:hypothetical protein